MGMPETGALARVGLIRSLSPPFRIGVGTCPGERSGAGLAFLPCSIASPARRQERSARRRSEQPACVQHEQRQPPRRGNGFGGEALSAPLHAEQHQIGGLERLKKWIATRQVGFFPSPGEKPLDEAFGRRHELEDSAALDQDLLAFANPGPVGSGERAVLPEGLN